MAKEDKKFWIGLAVSLLTTAVAIGTAWGCLKTDVANSRLEIDRIKNEKNLERNEMRSEIRCIADRTIEIQTDVKWLKTRLSRDRPAVESGNSIASR